MRKCDRPQLSWWSVFSISSIINLYVILTSSSELLMMASSTAPTPTFSEADVYHYCLLKINKSLTEPIFRQLLSWVNPQWKSHIDTFITYLASINVKEEDFMRHKNKIHKDAIRKDPSGRTWDVTLTYCVIKDINCGLADKNNEDAWTKDTNCLEFFITKVKNGRNNIAHLSGHLDETAFKKWCKTNITDLENLLSRIRLRCPQVRQEEIDERITEVRLFINEVMNSPVDQSGFDPLKYEEYKQVMENHTVCVKAEGKESLKERHRNREYLEVTSFLASKIDLPIEETYVEMVLKKGVSGKEHHLEVKHLLDGTDAIYYLEGRAGVGKTSLVKYLTMVWTNENGKVEGLEEYDLFFHLKCRDHISTFDHFLTLSLPTVIDKMSIDTLRSILYGLKIIIVFDGYDEKNKYSVQVLEEILSLKKDYKFTIVVTSRPETRNQFFQLANSYGIPVKHIEVLGIPKSRRTEFLQKYAHSMGCINIDDLLRYIKRTENRLSALWELPYNLSILAILWMRDPSIIDSITTSLELHWQMHQTYKSKLNERLLNYPETKHLQPSVVNRKIEDFLHVLCQISVTAIAKDDITLSIESYQTLSNKCFELEIPTEEMVGAFLKPTYSGSDKRYGFPHKGIQDFLAALYIHKTLNASCNFDVGQLQQRFMNELALHNAPENFCQNMKAFFDNYKPESDLLGATGGPSLESKSIRKILRDITGDVSDGKLEKFQNMLLSLIGILYMERKTGSIQDSIKQDALELLRDSGVKTRAQWLMLLNDVKCDEFVATFISEQTSVLKGRIKITDGNVFAYNSLFKGAKPPLRYDIPAIDIHVREDVANTCDFLSRINELMLQVKDFLITESNIKDYTAILRSMKTKFVNPEKVSVEVKLRRYETLFDIWKELEDKDLHVRELDFWGDFSSSSASTVSLGDRDVISKLLQSCRYYCGTWNPVYQIPRNMKRLQVGIPDDTTMDALFASFTKKTKMEQLKISFRTDISPAIRRIPKTVTDVLVYVTDVTEERVEKVGEILRGFDRTFVEASFPRCQLNYRGLCRMLKSLHGVSVELGFVFPDKIRPKDGEELKRLTAQAKTLTEREDGVRWMDDEGIWGIRI